MELFAGSTRIRNFLGKEKQYYPVEDIEVMFIDSQQPEKRIAKSLYVWDISEQSCSFETDEIKDFKTGQTGELKIKQGFHTDVIPNVKIERTRENGMIVSFKSTEKVTKYIAHKEDILTTSE